MQSLKEVSFSVQMKTLYMFDFLYWHNYHGYYGILNYAFSLAGVAALLAGFGEGKAGVTVVLVFLALLFTVINPLLLLYKAARQVKRTKNFQKPLRYSFCEDGFRVSQEEASETAEWESVVELRETGKNIVLYLGAANALVLPKAEIGEQLPEFKQLIRTALPQQAKRLKK